jgi:putative hydrolase of the HAD superfamily
LQTVERAVAACGLPAVRVARLVSPLAEAFTGYRPRRLPLYEGARAALALLAARYPLACLTGGDPREQRAKLAATGVRGFFTVVVTAGEPGRRPVREPDPDRLRDAADRLGVRADRLALIGSRSWAAAARALGARSIGVHNGDHSDVVDTTANAHDLLDAAALLLAG